MKWWDIGKDLLYVHCYFIKFLITLKFGVSDKISTCLMIELYEPPQNANF